MIFFSFDYPKSNQKYLVQKTRKNRFRSWIWLLSDSMCGVNFGQVRSPQVSLSGAGFASRANLQALEAGEIGIWSDRFHVEDMQCLQCFEVITKSMFFSTFLLQTTGRWYYTELGYSCAVRINSFWISRTWTLKGSKWMAALKSVPAWHWKPLRSSKIDGSYKPPQKYMRDLCKFPSSAESLAVFPTCPTMVKQYHIQL